MIRNIIALPSRFASVKKMYKFIQCVVILHKTMVGGRLFAELRDEDEFETDSFGEEATPPMWEGIARLSILSEAQLG